MWSPSRNLCRPAGRGERAALAGARHCAGQLDEQALVQLARAALHALAHLARPAARLERHAFFAPAMLVRMHMLAHVLATDTA